MFFLFWFKHIFPIKYKIRILDLMLLLKNSVPFEGLYNNSPFNASKIAASENVYLT